MKKSKEKSAFQITYTRWDDVMCNRRRKVTHQMATDFEDAYE